MKVNLCDRCVPLFLAVSNYDYRAIKMTTTGKRCSRCGKVRYCTQYEVTPKKQGAKEEGEATDAGAAGGGSDEG